MLNDNEIAQCKELYLQELRKTNREGIEFLIDWLEDSDFFYSPASTMYHGNYAGGLCEHSLNVNNCLEYLYSNLKGSREFNIPDIDSSSLKLVALLHDICKANTYIPGTRNVKNEQTGQWEKVPTFRREPKFAMGHASKSLFIAQKFIQLSPEEAQAIFWHMGAYDISDYNTHNELGAAYTTNLMAFLLNQADMMATYICENKLYI